jgi:hypothetical protein
MPRSSSFSRACLLALVLAGLAGVPLLAANSAIGSVTRSTNARLSGQKLLANTAIFSGDTLQVNDGIAVVSVPTSNEIILGSETVASFSGDPKDITVKLSKGNLSMIHSSSGSHLQVTVEEISITADTGGKVHGVVAMVRDAVVITAKQGALVVDDQGTSQTVPQGKTVVIRPHSKKRAGGFWLDGGAVGAAAVVGGDAAAAKISASSQNSAACTNTPTASATLPSSTCP